jgi:hypothetical protein
MNGCKFSLMIVSVNEIRVVSRPRSLSTTFKNASGKFTYLFLVLLPDLEHLGVRKANAVHTL